MCAAPLWRPAYPDRSVYLSLISKARLSSLGSPESRRGECSATTSSCKGLTQRPQIFVHNKSWPAVSFRSRSPSKSPPPDPHASPDPPTHPHRRRPRHGPHIPLCKFRPTKSFATRGAWEHTSARSHAPRLSRAKPRRTLYGGSCPPQNRGDCGDRRTSSV